MRGFEAVLSCGMAMPSISSFCSSAEPISESLVSMRNFLRLVRMGFQASCCGQGWSSLQLERPTAQDSTMPQPSTMSTISSRQISEGGFARAKPPPRPLAETSSFSLTSCWKIFATKCLGSSVSSQSSSRST